MAAARARLADRATRRATLPEMPMTRAGWDVQPLAARRALISALIPGLRLARPTRVRRAFDPARVLFD